MALFSRYKRLGDDPFGQIPDSEADLPGASLPDVYGATSYQDDDRSGDYGNDAPDAPTSGAPPRPGVDMPPPQPSMRADSMDKAKNLKQVAAAPVPPPLGNDLADGAPTPPAGLDGAPKPPPSASDIAQSALQKYSTLEGPKKPKSNVLQTIGQTILSASRFGPEGAEAIIHPKFAAQDREFKTQKGELANTVTLADKTQKVLGDEDVRQGNADTREQNALTAAHNHGIEIVPPGVKPPDGYVQTISPLAGNKKYTGATAWRDPNFGKFQVTPEQAALSNGAAAAGQWLPLSEMTQFIKGGVEQNKPGKADFVNVAPSTAKAMGVVAQPNDDGTVSVPTTTFNAHLSRENPKPKEIPPATQIGLRRMGLPANTDINTLTPEQATQLAQFSKADAQEFHVHADSGAATTAALDRELNHFAKPHEKALADSGAQLDKILDAQKMVAGGAMNQALGIPKVLTALVSGAGSGVRITQAELNSIAHARGFGGDIEGWFNKISGQGQLTRTQQNQLSALLSDVQNRILKKRQIASDTLDAMNSAGSREEFAKADKAAREKLSAMEGPQQQPAQQTQGSSGYQVGHVYGGLTYLGGDPHKKASWK